MIPELTGDSVEIGDPDGCPLTMTDEEVDSETEDSTPNSGPESFQRTSLQKEITCSMSTFRQRWSLYGQRRPHHNGWQKHINGIQKRPEKFQIISENLKMSSQRSPSMHCQNGRYGTVPLSWNLAPSPPTARSIHCHPKSRMS